MSPVQMKMARAALDLTIDQLAGKVGIGPADVSALESGATVDPRIEGRVRAVLEEAGIEWIGQDGVRFKDPTGAAIPVDELNSANDE